MQTLHLSLGLRLPLAACLAASGLALWADEPKRPIARPLQPIKRVVHETSEEIDLVSEAYEAPPVITIRGLENSAQGTSGDTKPRSTKTTPSTTVRRGKPGPEPAPNDDQGGPPLQLRIRGDGPQATESAETPARSNARPASRGLFGFGVLGTPHVNQPQQPAQRRPAPKAQPQPSQVQAGKPQQGGRLPPVVQQEVDDTGDVSISDTSRTEPPRRTEPSNLRTEPPGLSDEPQQTEAPALTVRTEPRRTEPKQTTPPEEDPEGDPPQPTARQVTAPKTPRSEKVDLSVILASFETADAVEPEAARLKGIQPGVSTMADLDKAWGQPNDVEKEDGFERRYYTIERLKAVEVSVHGGKVTAIAVQLDQAFEPAKLAAELRLDAFEAVIVADDTGELLGQVYPERGVMLLFENIGGVAMVRQMLLEAIDAEPFLLRAEANWQKHYDKTLADVRAARRLAPTNARAAVLEAKVLASSGQPKDALDAISVALEEQPDNMELRLVKVAALEEAGDVLAATKEAREVVASDAPDHVRAQAMVQLGSLIANGPGRDYKRALEMHQAAIKLAEPLLADRNLELRRAAQETLLEAHMGVAQDIAWGRWKSKDRTVPKWLDQADTLAKAATANEWTKLNYELRVAACALSAYVGMQKPLNDDQWTDRAISAAKELAAATNDPLRLQQLDWQLGSALHDALQVYLMQGNYEAALKYGMLAVEHLEKGLPTQKKNPGATYALGRCYFRVGSIYALEKEDHHQAVLWFEKAVPLVEGQLPISALADIGRQGETLVSIGVSYWEVGKQKDAIRVTTRGLELMEKAVADEILPSEALSVPYANLAAMHRYLGAEDQAKKFEGLAEQRQKTERK